MQQSRKMPPEVGAKRTKKPSGSTGSSETQRMAKTFPSSPASIAALGFRVGRIEAAHEADHHHLTGTVGGGGDRPVAIGRLERQGFLAEHVFARVDRGDHLIGVKRSRASPARPRLDRDAPTIPPIRGRSPRRSATSSPNARSSPIWARRGDQPSAGDPEREVFGVATAKPSEADDPDANRFRRHEALLSEIWPIRHGPGPSSRNETGAMAPIENNKSIPENSRQASSPRPPKMPHRLDCRASERRAGASTADFFSAEPATAARRRTTPARTLGGLRNTRRTGRRFVAETPARGAPSLWDSDDAGMAKRVARSSHGFLRRLRAGATHRENWLRMHLEFQTEWCMEY